LGQPQAATSRLKKISFFWPEFHNVFPYFFLEIPVNFLKKISKKHRFVNRTSQYTVEGEDEGDEVLIVKALPAEVIYAMLFENQGICEPTDSASSYADQQPVRRRRRVAAVRSLNVGGGTIPESTSEPLCEVFTESGELNQVAEKVVVTRKHFEVSLILPESPVFPKSLQVD
jgi:hypothetical protein